jgi:hypothetical protein
MNDEQFKLMMIELRRIGDAVNSLRSDWRAVSHDVRVTRENVDVIKARIPYVPMDHEATNGNGAE